MQTITMSDKDDDVDMDVDDDKNKIAWRYMYFFATSWQLSILSEMKILTRDIKAQKLQVPKMRQLSQLQ